MKIKQILKSQKGESNYVSAMIYILVAVVCIAFIINIFSIVSAKQQLDYMADQMTKQIQLAGGVNSDTDSLFNQLSSSISGASNVRYEIEADYKTPTPTGMRNAIQLSTPFHLTISADTILGGFGDFIPVQITVTSKGSGVSEKYWK